MTAASLFDEHLRAIFKHIFCDLEYVRLVQPQNRLSASKGENMKDLELYYCPYCGKIIAVIKKTNVPTVCCGMPMQHIVPGTVDASIEKHVPVIKKIGNSVIVSIGSEEHPSTDDHYIQWIVLLTSKGLHARSIRPGERPRAIFLLNENEDVHAAMEYCNLHKLWRKDVA